RAACSHECRGVRVVQVEAGLQMIWCKSLSPIVPVIVNWAGMQFGLLPGFAPTPASADRAPHSHVLTPLFSPRSSFQDEGECHRGTPPQGGIVGNACTPRSPTLTRPQESATRCFSDEESRHYSVP